AGLEARSRARVALLPDAPRAALRGRAERGPPRARAPRAWDALGRASLRARDAERRRPARARGVERDRDARRAPPSRLRALREGDRGPRALRPRAVRPLPRVRDGAAAARRGVVRGDAQAPGRDRAR